MTIEEMNTGLTKTINNAPTSNTKSAAPADGNGTHQAMPAQAATVASFAGLVNDMYVAQRQANLDALEREYTAAIGDLERQKAATPAQYTAAKNATAGTNALERRSTNEMFTANGLSSGAKAQGNIAQSNALQRDLGELELAEARALAEIDGQRSQISAQYQARVREAIMNNEMQKAAALYDEAIRHDNAMVDAAKESAAAQKEKAAMLASVGDFSGYSALGYSPAEIAALQAGYQAKQYRGSGGGGTTTEDELTNYFEKLREMGVTDEGDAYQMLYSMGAKGDELAEMAAYYMDYIRNKPAVVPINNKVVENTYNQYLNGNLTAKNAAESIVAHHEQGHIPDTVANYLLYTLGY